MTCAEGHKASQLRRILGFRQTDWQFDRSQQICRDCHTPLDRQQPHRVLGFRDREK